MSEPAAGAGQDDRCPRCGDRFHCGIGDDAPCPCTTVTLDGATQDALRRRYTGCLCLRCLVALSTDPEASTGDRR